MFPDAVHTLLELRKDAVVIRDDQGSVIAANLAAREFYGSGDSLPTAELPENDRGRMRELLEEGKSQSFRTARLNAGSNLMEVDLEWVPIRSEDKRIVGCIEILKTAPPEPATNILVMAAAHDLRSPLAIMNNLVMLMEHQAESKHLEMMKKQLLLCESIVDNFLEFSSRRSPRTRMVHFNSLISQTLAILPAFQKQELIFQEEAQVEIQADPGQIRQVILNLLQNALEAMENKAGKIWIRLSENDRFAQMDITDTGPGIAAHHLPKLFQPLFSTKERGFGLGLVSCKQIVDAHGGRIEVRSEAGSGTTFSVKLPVSLR